MLNEKSGAGEQGSGAGGVQQGGEEISQAEITAVLQQARAVNPTVIPPKLVDRVALRASLAKFAAKETAPKPSEPTIGTAAEGGTTSIQQK